MADAYSSFTPPRWVGDIMVAGLRVVYGRDHIAARVEAVAREIDRWRIGAPMVAVCVLRGAFAFFGDLVRHLRPDGLEIDFVRLASYGDASESSGSVECIVDLASSIEGKDVLIVEDVVDTGRTAAFLKARLMGRSPARVWVAALVDKPSRRANAFSPDFSCFVLQEDKFIVGYGMDLAERYRTLPDICEIVPA